jgi:hypothetical protein
MVESIGAKTIHPLVARGPSSKSQKPLKRNINAAMQRKPSAAAKPEIAASQRPN